MRILTLAVFFLAILTKTNGQTEMSAQDSVLYSFGVLISNDLKGSSIVEINSDFLNQGLAEGLAGQPKITVDQAQKVITEFRTKELRSEGENFLRENAKKEGVISLENGIQYKVVKSGTGGPKPTASSNVKVHYEGTLIDGTIFDSSIKRNEPISFGLNRVIKGWQEALQLMSVGDRWVIYLPYNLAYGERGSGQTIPPYAALIFDVELLAINE